MSAAPQTSAKLCLHCRLVEAVYAHFEAKGMKVGGDTLLDMPEIAENIAQVLAEFFAGENDKREQDRRLKELFRAVQASIPVIRGRGRGAFPVHVERH